MTTLQPSFRTKLTRRADSTARNETSLFALDGRAVVKDALHVGVGAGFVIVVTILALGSSVAALMTRNGVEE